MRITYNLLHRSGVWRDVMELISSIAIVYIFALVFFTSHYFEDQTWSMRWVYFLLVEHVALAVKHYIAEAVSDVPESVAMQLERQKVLISKVFDNEADEADEEYKGISVMQRLINIQITDDDWEDPSGNDYVKKHIQAYRSLTQNDDDDEMGAVEMGLINRTESFMEESKLPSTPSVSDFSRGGRVKRGLNEIEAYIREPSRVGL